MEQQITIRSVPERVFRLHNLYFKAFVSTMVVCWSPFKALAYVLPLVVLFWIAFASGSRLIRRRQIKWFGIWLVGIALYASMRSDFVLHSALIAIVTYGTFAFLYVVPTRMLARSNLLNRMMPIVVLVIVLQSLLGIAQAGYGFTQTGTFDLNTGDYVEGTISPWLGAKLAFANPMFATNMAFMLLALLPAVVLQKRWRFAFLLGTFVLVLASVMHVLFFLLAALVLSFVLYQPPVFRQGSRAVVLTMCLLVPAGMYFFLRANLQSTIGIVAETLVATTPRAMITLHAIQDMPAEYRWMPVVGLGPGQFSSRASLIGTGMYFGGIHDPRPVPLLPTGSSNAFHDYLEELWYAVTDNPYWGSTQKPFYSWLSVYTEFGVFVLASLSVVSLGMLVRIRKEVRTPAQRVLATSTGAGIVLFLLLGIQENYWEIPQAVFIGAMLLKVMYADLVYGTSPIPQAAHKGVL